MKQRLMALLLVAVVCSSWTSGVSATTGEAPNLGIAPLDSASSYFEVELKPGEERTLRVELSNHGAEAVLARSYAADVYSLLNGGFGVELHDEPASGVTMWLDYGSDVVELDAGQVVERDFTIRMPEGTKPGEYITSLVVENAEPFQTGGDDAGIVVNQVVRRAIAVAITAPGPVRPRLVVPAASYQLLPAYARVLVSIANRGNVLLKPAGEITLRDDEGRELQRLPIAMGSVYAGTTTAIEMILPSPLPPGDYTIEVDLADAAHDVVVVKDRLIVLVPTNNVASHPDPPAGVTIASATIAEVRDPVSGMLQFVEGVISIENVGLPLDDVRITLHVRRNGELVEDYPLASSMAIANPPTEVRQRYVPIGGWLVGSYTFAVSVQVVDRATGVVTVLATADLAAPVVVA